MQTQQAQSGQRMALIAALLGWMFDGMEMGLFPLVGKKALGDLPATSATIEEWFSIINAGFLIGAAAGGVLFGWLGDRIGRVRAMTIAVFVYAGFSGLCAIAQHRWQLAGFRFIGSLGMGGEWALGVALVMEMWPGKSRVWLAGLMGAFGNLGYFLLACVALLLNRFPESLSQMMSSLGMPNSSGSGNWRLLMAVGASPAILTFLIRIFVPESEKWTQQKENAKSWSGRDLLAVLLGTIIAAFVLYTWIVSRSWAIRLSVTLFSLVFIAICFLFPARQYLVRSGVSLQERRKTIGRMLLAAGLSGVPLLATWGGVMWVYNWVSELAPNNIDARPITQASSALGASIGGFIAAWLGSFLGRKAAYALFCVCSSVTLFSFYSFNKEFNAIFVITAGLVGLVTASFYGWLPLYLPELFNTGMRATGQGFGFNFGRILAAIGSLQTGALLNAFDNNYAKACSCAAAVYGIGLILICFAPETKNKNDID